MGRTAPAAIRWGRRAVVVTVVAVVVLPAVRDRDSFPLSTYPMYAERRGPVDTFPTAVGIDAAGQPQRLSMATIARTDDPLIATSVVRAAIRAGRAGALCAEIAARAPDRLAAVEVVEERHDLVAGATGRHSLLDRAVRARCRVPP